MRRNFRIQASNISHGLNSSKYKTKLLENQYFKEFAQTLHQEEINQLLSIAKIEFFTSRKHISINSQKLYFTFSHTSMLTSGTQAKGPSPSVIDEFERKYVEIMQDIDKIYKRKIEVLYHRFEHIQESKQAYLYNMSKFFNSNLQKTNDIIITKTDDIIVIFQKNKLSQSIYSKFKKTYENRYLFLKSFPLIKYLPDFYFHLYIPCFVYNKYYSSSKFILPQQQNVYFLINGELQFSKKNEQQNIPIYKIIGSQMFIIGQGVNQVKIHGQSAEMYSIKKSALDKLVSFDDNSQSYHSDIKNFQSFNRGLKQKACCFHKSTYSTEVDNKQNQSQVSPWIQKSFQNLNIFPKQFNKHINTLGIKKTKVLTKLLQKSHLNSYLYEYKPIVKTVPNMQQIQSNIKTLKQIKYSKIKQPPKQNNLISMYKSLVKQGLQQELLPLKTSPKQRRLLRTMNNNSFDSFSDTVVKSSIFDILNRYN